MYYSLRFVDLFTNYEFGFELLDWSCSEVMAFVESVGVCVDCVVVEAPVGHLCLWTIGRSKLGESMADGCVRKLSEFAVGGEWSASDVSTEVYIGSVVELTVSDTAYEDCDASATVKFVGSAAYLGVGNLVGMSENVSSYYDLKSVVSLCVGTAYWSDKDMSGATTAVCMSKVYVVPAVVSVVCEAYC